MGWCPASGPGFGLGAGKGSSPSHSVHVDTGSVTSCPPRHSGTKEGLLGVVMLGGSQDLGPDFLGWG